MANRYSMQERTTNLFGLCHTTDEASRATSQAFIAELPQKTKSRRKEKKFLAALWRGYDLARNHPTSMVSPSSARIVFGKMALASSSNGVRSV